MVIVESSMPLMMVTVSLDTGKKMLQWVNTRSSISKVIFSNKELWKERN